MARIRLVATMAAALGVAVLGAPAAAGEGLRVVEVPGAPCGTVKVINGDDVVWERSLTGEYRILWRDTGNEAGPFPYCLPVRVHDRYFRIGESLLIDCLREGFDDECSDVQDFTWYHTDGTRSGTVRMDFLRSGAWLGHVLPHRDRLFVGSEDGPGVALLRADPTSVRTIKRFPKADAIIRLRVSGDRIRFTTVAGKVRKHWVSDGTRKGTHVVKR